MLFKRYLVSIIESKLSPGSVLYVDLPGFSNPDAIFNSMRPDITIVNGSTVSVLELTCCYEQNLDKSRLYKINKYSNLEENCKLNKPVNVFTLEISSLGFANFSDLNKFCNNAGVFTLDVNSLERSGELSLRCSFFIFCCRHKTWPANITDPIV